MLRKGTWGQYSFPKSVFYQDKCETSSGCFAIRHNMHNVTCCTMSPAWQPHCDFSANSGQQYLSQRKLYNKKYVKKKLSSTLTQHFSPFLLAWTSQIIHKERRRRKLDLLFKKKKKKKLQIYKKNNNKKQSKTMDLHKHLKISKFTLSTHKKR